MVHVLETNALTRYKMHNPPPDVYSIPPFSYSRVGSAINPQARPQPFRASGQVILSDTYSEVCKY